jgi:hypothetical protein
VFFILFEKFGFQDKTDTCSTEQKKHEKFFSIETTVAKYGNGQMPPAEFILPTLYKG